MNNIEISFDQNVSSPILLKTVFRYLSLNSFVIQRSECEMILLIPITFKEIYRMIQHYAVFENKTERKH